MNLFELQKKRVEDNLRKSYEPAELTKALEPDLVKGKKANIGEVREWGGKKYQKGAGGWNRMSEETSKQGMKVSERLREQEKQKESNPFHGAEVKEEDGKFYLKRGDYYLNSDAKDTVNVKNAVSFPSKESLYAAMGEFRPKNS